MRDIILALPLLLSLPTLEWIVQRRHQKSREFIQMAPKSIIGVTTGTSCECADLHQCNEEQEGSTLQAQKEGDMLIKPKVTRVSWASDNLSQA